MNRRSFIAGILSAAVAPQFLKGANRQWKRTETLWVPPSDWVFTKEDLGCSDDGCSYINMILSITGYIPVFHKKPFEIIT